MKRPVLLIVLGTLVCAVWTYVMAGLMARINGPVPLNPGEWLVALVAFAGLATTRAVPGPKRPASPVRRAPRAAFHPGAARFRIAARAGSPLAADASPAPH
jgi:hypothetical protein